MSLNLARLAQKSFLSSSTSIARRSISSTLSSQLLLNKTHTDTTQMSFKKNSSQTRAFSSNVSSSSSTSDSPLPEITLTKTNSSTPPQPFNTTPSLTAKLQGLHPKLHPDSPGIHLRVTVDAGGCSGFQYDFKVEAHDDSTFDTEEDIRILGSGSTHDASPLTYVVTDKSSLEYLRGCTVTFSSEMIRSSFSVMDNPLAESACGCGSSFAMKNFESNPGAGSS